MGCKSAFLSKILHFRLQLHEGLDPVLCTHEIEIHLLMIDFFIENIMLCFICESSERHLELRNDLFFFCKLKVRNRQESDRIIKRKE